MQLISIWGMTNRFSPSLKTGIRYGKNPIDVRCVMYLYWLSGLFWTVLFCERIHTSMCGCIQSAEYRFEFVWCNSMISVEIVVMYFEMLILCIFEIHFRSQPKLILSPPKLIQLKLKQLMQNDNSILVPMRQQLVIKL